MRYINGFFKFWRNYFTLIGVCYTIVEIEKKYRERTEGDS